LPALELTAPQAAVLAAQMVDTSTPPGGGQWPPSSGTPADPEDNPAIAAGWTYFGQFLDHDLTYDPVSRLTGAGQADDDLLDLRTARLDLDSLFGTGPDDQPYLYSKADPAKLLVVPHPQEGSAFDLPRNPDERALIGDPRNDVHIIISQLHLAFAQFHNHVVDAVRTANPAWTAPQVLAEAKRQVIWHYQWLVVHQYLDLTVGQPLRTSVLSDGTPGAPGTPGTPPGWTLAYYHLSGEPAYIPKEFSAAAFRFGHSQVRPTYKLNAGLAPLPVFDGSAAPGRGDLRGFRTRPPGWTVDWSLFFDLGSGTPPQASRRIDTLLAPALSTLPTTVVTDGATVSLAERNLLRGAALHLPSGQDVARAMDITPIAGTISTPTGAVAMPDPAPLWFYLLAESASSAAGVHLGPTAGRLVAEVLVGLLVADDSSYLRTDLTWRPTLGGTSGEFTIADVLRVGRST